MEWILIVVLVAVCVAWVMCLLSNRRLRRIVREEQRVRLMRRSFLKSLSDETYIPLRKVRDVAHTLSREDIFLSKFEKKGMAETLKSHADFVETLWSELLLFGDVMGSDDSISRTSFSPNELCRHCLETNLMNIYHQQSVNLIFKKDISDDVFIITDRHLVELIINKLVLNACRFTDKGQVCVGCNLTENDGMLTIFVSDTGRGLPKDRKNRLFNWFEAPDDMHDEAELDLSICKRIAEKLGGTLYVDEFYQRQGTRIVLVLPLR